MTFLKIPSDLSFLKLKLLFFFLALTFSSTAQDNCSSYNFGNCASISSCNSNIEVTPCLIPDVVSPGGCTPIGDPYLANNCIAPLQKILSKPIRMSHLGKFITKIGPNPGDICHVDRGNGVIDACDAEPEDCADPYCPSRYCEEIKMLVDMEATYIFEAFHTWAKQHQIKPGGTAMNGACQIVKDINAAYDCAGLRRPVIQASILNNIGNQLGPIPGGTRRQDYWPIKIPQCVQEAFGQNYDPTLEFIHSEIVKDAAGGNFNWDVTKLQAKMWVFYNAMMYINAGYTALHMGMIGGNVGFGTNDNLNSTGSDRLEESAELFNMIRCYAESQGSFALITGERFPPETQMYHGNITEKNLLFDFDNIPLRVREVDDLWNYCCAGSTNCPIENGGNGNLPGYDPEGGPCASDMFNAYLDTCIINMWRHLEGGVTPRGCTLDVVPYVVAFDFGCGIADIQGQGQVVPGFDGGAYAYGDVYWFSQVISRECAAYFLENTICKLKQISNGHGSLQLPGIVHKHDCEDVPDWSYRMSQDPLILAAIDNVWKVDEVLNMTYDDICLPDPVFTTSCNGEDLGSPSPGGFDFFERRTRKYVFSVIDPDCSSTYSWHVKNLTTNTWLPIVYGNSRTIMVNEVGVYKISLRQDNANLLPFGTQTVQTTLTLYPHCCELFQGPFGKKIQPPKSIDAEAKIYPTPSTDEINIEVNLSGDDRLSFEIWDSYGRLVRQLQSGADCPKGQSVHRYNIAELVDGVYFITIRGESGMKKNLKLLKASPSKSK